MLRSLKPGAALSSPTMRLTLLLAAAVLLLDQLSKWAMVELVLDDRRRIAVLPFFNFSLVYNPGISFGLLGSDAAWGPYVLSAVAVAVCVALFFWARRAETRMLAVAIGLVIGGAIGNVIDRLRFGAVVDFLDFYIPGTQLPHWPAFNVADAAIVIGVGLILVDGLFASRAKSN